MSLFTRKTRPSSDQSAPLKMAANSGQQQQQNANSSLIGPLIQPMLATSHPYFPSYQQQCDMIIQQQQQQQQTQNNQSYNHQQQQQYIYTLTGLQNQQQQQNNNGYYSGSIASSSQANNPYQPIIPSLSDSHSPAMITTLISPSQIHTPSSMSHHQSVPSNTTATPTTAGNLLNYPTLNSKLLSHLTSQHQLQQQQQQQQNQYQYQYLQHQMYNLQQQQQQQCSSSATSSIYHIYDQINPIIPTSTTTNATNNTINNNYNNNNTTTANHLHHQQPSPNSAATSSTTTPTADSLTTQTTNASNNIVDHHQRLSLQNHNKTKQSTTTASNPMRKTTLNHHHHHHHHHPHHHHHLSSNSTHPNLPDPHRRSSPHNVLSSLKSIKCQHLLNYYTQVKYLYRLMIVIILLIVGAITIRSLITLTLNNQGPAASSSLHNDKDRLQQQQIISSSSNNNNGIASTKIYSNVDEQSSSNNSSAGNDQLTLRSKLVFGEFVITSQNYSASISSTRSPLAISIVKLLDQVFLNNDMRRFYARSEVTSISRAIPVGIKVMFRIVLSESIEYAAPQIGMYFEESLRESGSRLAGQSSLMVDIRSMKLNAVPDKDLRQGIVPPGLVPEGMMPTRVSTSALQQQQQADNDNSQMMNVVKSSSSSHHHQDANGSSQQEFTGPTSSSDNQFQPAPVQYHQSAAAEQQPMASQHNQQSVVWSEWSPWSSCLDKNGLCDATRTHSRIRNCMSQTTGQSLPEDVCKQRFNSHEISIEISDCQKECSLYQAPVIVSSPPSSSSSYNEYSPQLSTMDSQQPLITSSEVIEGLVVTSASIGSSSSSSSSSMQQQQQQQDNTLSSSPTSANQDMMMISSTDKSPLTNAELNNALVLSSTQDTLTCSNCTSSEICLLQLRSKVPFCAKILNYTDSSGCGGWCTGSNQLCQKVNPSTFRCIHDSECLADEWQCLNSACIPSSRRCDGHPNCYDSSDEQDCPNVLTVVSAASVVR